MNLYTVQEKNQIERYTKVPKVYNIYHPSCPANAVYCGRGGPYGNPYLIGKHGTRDQVCDKFRDNVLPTLDVFNLRGKDLKCYCKPRRCHCDDILIKANCEKENCIYPRCPEDCIGRSR